MKSKDIRELFLNYFEEKNHLRLEGGSLIPSDPTLLFTIAGMVPLKPYFLGSLIPPKSRITTVQKCMRVNDIDKIGTSIRHVTLLEMLGNFSFGDYFKEESISMAWELITTRFGLPEDKLVVTIFRDDEESSWLWKKIAGLPDNKIISLGEDDNFWRMGETGPCGPCSEIYFDRGSGSFRHEEFPGDRFIEFWNLVFMQFSCNKNNFVPLPQKNIDTGMGLERIACILQNTPSVFETDLFLPVISRAEEVLGIEYKDMSNIVPIRIIADHIRAITFLFSERLIPSNEWRGYVLRRLIRRAFMKGYKYGIKKAFLYKIVERVVSSFGEFYPVLKENHRWVEEGVKTEEERFLSTIGKGLDYFNEHLKKMKENKMQVFSGKDAFFLYDTYGFPLELQKEILEEENFTLVEPSFIDEMEKQKALSRSSTSIYQPKFTNNGGSTTDIEKLPPTKFIGYDYLESKATVLRKERREDDSWEYILDVTPFYSFGGGELSDQGVIEGENGKGFIYDTYLAPNGRIIHLVKMLLGSIEDKEVVRLIVDIDRRRSMEAHHTVTHLLQAALRKVLGPQIKQAGSLVSPDYLRFDFTYHKALTIEEIEEVERLVNFFLIQDFEVISFIRSYKEAINIGAVALFSEKYGSEVRIIKINNISMELCSGTHLRRTGEAGIFCLVKEEGIGTGLRRIEALAGVKAFDYLKVMRQEQKKALDLLRQSEGLLSGVNKLVENVKELQKDKERLLTHIVNLYKDYIIKNSYIIENISIVASQLDILEPRAIRNLADVLANMLEEYVIVLIGSDAGYIFTKSSPGAVVKGYNAGKIASELALLMGGKGGGNAEAGQGGFKNKPNFNNILNILNNLLKELKKV